MPHPPLGQEVLVSYPGYVVYSIYASTTQRMLESHMPVADSAENLCTGVLEARISHVLQTFSTGSGVTERTRKLETLYPILFVH